MIKGREQVYVSDETICRDVVRHHDCGPGHAHSGLVQLRVVQRHRLSALVKSQSRLQDHRTSGPWNTNMNSCPETAFDLAAVE